MPQSWMNSISLISGALDTWTYLTVIIMKMHFICIGVLAVIVPGLALEVEATEQNRFTVPFHTHLSLTYSDVSYANPPAAAVAVPREDFHHNVEHTANLRRSKRQAYYPYTRCINYPYCRPPVDNFLYPGIFIGGYPGSGRRSFRRGGAGYRYRNRGLFRGGRQPQSLIVGRNIGLVRGGGGRSFRVAGLRGGRQGFRAGGLRGGGIRGGRGGGGGFRGGRGGGGGRGISLGGRGGRAG